MIPDGSFLLDLNGLVWKKKDNKQMLKLSIKKNWTKQF